MKRGAVTLLLILSACAGDVSGRRYVTETAFLEDDTYKLEVRDRSTPPGDLSRGQVIASRDEGAWNVMQDQCGLWRPELIRKADGESASTYQFRCT